MRASFYAPTPSMGHPISGELWDCRLWSISEIQTTLSRICICAGGDHWQADR